MSGMEIGRIIGMVTTISRKILEFKRGEDDSFGTILDWIDNDAFFLLRGYTIGSNRFFHVTDIWLLRLYIDYYRHIYSSIIN